MSEVLMSEITGLLFIFSHRASVFNDERDHFILFVSNRVSQCLHTVRKYITSLLSFAQRNIDKNLVKLFNLVFGILWQISTSVDLKIHFCSSVLKQTLFYDIIISIALLCLKCSITKLRWVVTRSSELLYFLNTEMQLKYVLEFSARDCYVLLFFQNRLNKHIMIRIQLLTLINYFRVTLSMKCHIPPLSIS